jgi:hypothetical protein
MYFIFANPVRGLVDRLATRWNGLSAAFFMLRSAYASR